MGRGGDNARRRMTANLLSVHTMAVHTVAVHAVAIYAIGVAVCRNPISTISVSGSVDRPALLVTFLRDGRQIRIC